jgi:phosphate:Na+ symporter
VHTAFNVVGTAIGMLLLNQFIQLDRIATEYLNLNSMMQISFAHIIFNILATLLIYPFVKKLVQLVRKLIKGDEVEFREVDITLDPELVKSLPSAALGICKNNILKMGDITLEAFEESRNYLLSGNSHAHESMMQLEGIINSMDTKITDYLLLIAQENLSNNDLEEYTTNLQVTKNLERIGDLSTNLVEFYELIFDAKEKLSKAAIEDITQMMDLVNNMLTRAMRIYDEKDFSLHNSVLEDENYLDLLEYKARQKHFNRMASSECLAEVGGSVFVDIVGTIERIGDHACNISKNAINIHVTHEPKQSKGSE